PFDYLRWLVGDIDHVSAVESRHDALGVDVETCVEVTLQFATGASGHVHLDFIQRPTDHRILIIGSEGSVWWSQHDGIAHLHSAQGSQIVSPPDGFERNTMFLAEMRHFLACVRGVAVPACTLADGRAALEAVMQAKHAIAAGRMLAS